MWKPQQKVHCVLWLTEFKSVTRVQRYLRRERNNDTPTSKSIHEAESRWSIRQASNELQIPRSTAYDIVHKRLRLRAYKLQLLHLLKLKDHSARLEFSTEMMNRIGVDSNRLEHVIFSDESCFHICENVIKHNCHIELNENPQQLCVNTKGIHLIWMCS
ncbi:DUF4817 domain-containing protein [Trichonephila clavipes]|nr:DUF4817 domain-containing protein [Trichonephila clavipes]